MIEETSNLNTTVKETFSIEVEQYARAQDIDLLESLAHMAEKYGLIDTIKMYVSRPLKEKLEIEAIKNRRLKSSVSAPVTIHDAI